MSASDEKLIGFSKRAKEMGDDRRLGKYGADPFYYTYFHLRPTRSGITLYSTLPGAAMRGVGGGNFKQGQVGIDDVLSVFSLIEGCRPKVPVMEMHKVLLEGGFLKSTTPVHIANEDCLQAEMINGMISGKPEYEGMKFIGSEIIVDGTDSDERGNRFDIVALRGDVLCVFELKIKRENQVNRQVEGYKAVVRDPRKAALLNDLLEHYPVFPPRSEVGRDIDCRRASYYIVMPGNGFGNVTAENGNHYWFYETPSLTFHKNPDDSRPCE